MAEAPRITSRSRRRPPSVITFSVHQIPSSSAACAAVPRRGAAADPAPCFFTTKGGSGDGLGLVISHRIVTERHRRSNSAQVRTGTAI